ncbi:uncharacterized protein EKO05_0001746 [Ascochyta rabiei]|uniref:DNA binding n=1 Tax=Didymella rabiei TaxID=5454 RepID=A0A163BJJ3_DIDRA|nr:uncharacterized protein EKO05_0001746 [Ascochyta rabiei]KZM21806.1 DNA binding [Ascochyta rabiei]UPX11123.1 hypothetical protein EKO05_0001746 [Ascochyta rabiei]
MSSNDYSSYSYPYHQQSSAQPYSAYQTAPASNTSANSTSAEPSRQYSQAPSAATNQSADYLSYPEPSYGPSSSEYGAAQENNDNNDNNNNTWSASSNSYGAARDNGSRAAEVLRNMSNTGYAATTTALSQAGFTTINAANAHYPPGRSLQVQAQPLHTSHTIHGQTQARPSSVNTNQVQPPASRGLSSPATAAGYPTQRAQPQYHQQQAQQRTASPAQAPYSHNHAIAASRNASMAAAGTSQQYTDYGRRQLPDVDATQTAPNATPTTSYTPRAPAPTVQPPPSSISEPYTGSSTTVDPTAVYDPWPEYQRQQAARDAARAEQEKKKEEARKEEERLEEEERRWGEAKEAARQAQIAASQPKPKAKKAQTQPATATTAAQSNVPDVPESPAGGSELEAEIRAMMVKMRELNSKDPQLLARIWEEERRAKGAKTPTATAKAAPQPAVVPSAQVPIPSIANQGKKATPRESISAPNTKLTTLPQAQAVPASIRAPAAIPVRTGGNTIWPPEKKLELARAAAHYLTTKNPDRPIESEQVLQMLDGNPSYVELCERLEQMGFKLDRSIFAKSLLLAVPDVNSASRKTTRQAIPPATAPKAPAPPAVMKHPVPPAVMRHLAPPQVAPSPRYSPAAVSRMTGSTYPPFPDNPGSAVASSIPVAEMVPIKPELKPPANKEEAARKRNLSDLIDLTQLDEEDDMMPPMKRLNTNSMVNTYSSSHPSFDSAVGTGAAPINNFPTAAIPAPQSNEPPRTMPMQMNGLRYRAIVEPLEKKKALRRNTYNPATIARDVLLACGRHPSERQLNQHLDVLKTNLPHISNESDLSTIKWSLIDPGNPPPGYFKDGVQALTEGADEEDESEAEDGDRESLSHATGGEGARVQALPEATNPFIKQKRRGRKPRHSLPNATTTTVPTTPNRQASSSNMSVSAPRPSSAAGGVGYSAFRSATGYGPDGKPLPKKKGRPVGWRKAIHGSSAAQSRPAMNGHTGTHESQQPSTLRNVRTGGDEPILISSRSPSVATGMPRYQVFKCKWQNCQAELHNLETLQKHVFKGHCKERLHNLLECLWDGCGTEVTNIDPVTNMSLKRSTPQAFGSESAWRGHMQRIHFDPLAWEHGDGPAGGVSDAHDSEAYLSDAQGRRVTPRITADLERAFSSDLSRQLPASAPRGRGRRPKNTQEQEARDMQDRLVSRKRRMGGPGMDRGGATLVNEKRRRGLVDSDGMEEELVDAED